MKKQQKLYLEPKWQAMFFSLHGRFPLTRLDFLTALEQNRQLLCLFIVLCGERRECKARQPRSEHLSKNYWDTG